MTWETFTSFLLTALLIELTPGPNMAYLSVVTLTHGRRAGLLVVAGVALGLTIVGITSALGVAELVTQSRWLYEALRYAGVTYLLWLAYQSWREAGNKGDYTADPHPGAWFRRGLVTNLFNPKAALFYIATLPQFLPRSHSDGIMSALAESLILTVIYVAIATTVHLGLVVLSGQFHFNWRSGSRLIAFQRGMAVLLALIAIWLGFSTAR